MTPATCDILTFDGAYWFLSNFSSAPVVLDGVTYPTVEHAYQAGKTLDQAFRGVIASAPAARLAKRLGRRAPLRPGWEGMKVAIMEGLLRQKFHPAGNYAHLLLQTGNVRLVEGNTWGDRFWGQVAGEGENHLGELLMSIRSDLQQQATLAAPGAPWA